MPATPLAGIIPASEVHHVKRTLGHLGIGIGGVRGNGRGNGEGRPAPSRFRSGHAVAHSGYAAPAGGVAKVASVDKLSVLLVAVFAFAFLSERLTISRWLGAGFITLGAMLMVAR